MAGRPGAVQIVVMGVQGSGKTTIGSRLAARLGVPFVDGDSLHSDENKALMASGHPLTDEHRIPWLHAVGRELEAGAQNGIVVACSALKRWYRDLLREHAPETLIVFASGDIGLIRERIGSRRHEYMPPELLQSQFDALEEREPEERGVTVDVDASPDEIVDRIVAGLRDAAR